MSGIYLMPYSDLSPAFCLVTFSIMGNETLWRQLYLDILMENSSSAPQPKPLGLSPRITKLGVLMQLRQAAGQVEVQLFGHQNVLENVDRTSFLNESRFLRKHRNDIVATFSGSTTTTRSPPSTRCRILSGPDFQEWRRKSRKLENL